MALRSTLLRVRALVDAVTAQRFLREGDWYAGADMDAGMLTSRTFDNLMAFWPGMQTLMGKERLFTRGQRKGRGEKGRQAEGGRRAGRQGYLVVY